MTRNHGGNAAKYLRDRKKGTTLWNTRIDAIIEEMTTGAPEPEEDEGDIVWLWSSASIPWGAKLSAHIVRTKVPRPTKLVASRDTCSISSFSSCEGLEPASRRRLQRELPCGKSPKHVKGVSILLVKLSHLCFDGSLC